MTGWFDTRVHGKKSVKLTKKELHRQQQFRDQQRKTASSAKQRPKT